MTVSIVVLGSTGQVGTAFREVIPDAEFLDRRQANLADQSGLVDALDWWQPDFVVNCAAYTAVDAAESHPHEAMTINAVGPETIAKWCARNGSRFLTFSSDYVFDGTKTSPWVESDPTGPLNVYGLSKEKGERLVLDACRDSLIVRTSWVVSATHSNFVSAILELGAAGPVKVVGDQHGCPTVANDLARASWLLLEQGLSGLVHVTNQGATTWFGLARKAFELSGADTGLITACATEDFPTAAQRPRYSVLGSERNAETAVELRHWTDALGEMIARRRW